MSKYIDAEKLKRSVESIGSIPQKQADYNDGRDDVKMIVLDLIDSLQQEQPEVDLEKGIKNYLATECAEDDEPSVSEIARHFYELGLNARKEE